MGLPQIVINFTNIGASAIRRSAKGKVALIFEGEGHSRTFKNLQEARAAGLGDDLWPVELCFLGTPSRVSVVFENGDIFAALSEAMRLAGTSGWICAPLSSQSDVVSFIKEQRRLGKTPKAVTINALAPDCEGIVNFCSGGVTIAQEEGDVTVSAEGYAARIAGILAGLPLSRSATYYPLPEVMDFEPSADPDADIDSGRLILCSGSEGPRLGRAVTSLTSVTMGQSAENKKIKIVEAIDMIKADIGLSFEKDYIGKAINDYDNKLLFVTAVNGYFESLEGSVLDKSYDNRAFIDYDGQKTWLAQQGIDTEDMTETEILCANTDSYVFLGANIRFVDAMEDLTFNIVM